jgi:selenocysteine-specific elongation factor
MRPIGPIRPIPFMAAGVVKPAGHPMTPAAPPSIHANAGRVGYNGIVSISSGSRHALDSCNPMNDGTRNLVLGTAGHIDHGKTALVRALTGVDTDRLPAEKERGITIDLGFAALELGEIHLALVDVPGHERFIRNMLAGASGLDLALLIVAADDSVMPQTREHLEILRLLGLSGGVIAITKCDLAEPSWLDLVEEDVKSLVRGSFLDGAPIVRTSTVTGQGLDQLKEALAWAGAAVGTRNDPGLFRMAIDRSFTVAGHGTVVTGTVASGTASVGDELEWQPAGRLVRIRGLHRHDRPVERVGRGARAAINLAGVHHAEITRGQELASPGYLQATQVLAVDLVALEGAIRPLRHRGRYKLHLGTAEVSAVLSLLDPDDAGASGGRLAQLFSAEPIVAVHGQPFVVRDESPPATLGGGRVLQPAGRRLRRRDHAAISRLARLRSADPVERLRAVLAIEGLSAPSERRLCACSGVSIHTQGECLAALSRTGALVELPLGPRRTMPVLSEVAAELEDRALRALARLHAAHPRQSAIPRAQLAAALPDLANGSLAAGLLDRLAALGKIVAGPRSIALKGHEPKLSQAEHKLKNELADAIKAGGMSPPDAAELTASAGQRGPVVAELLALLCDEERLVEISSTLFFDTDCELELRRRVYDRLQGGATITMAELRDLLGTTRKYAVPLGEYLDRIGLTKREGDLRRLGPAGTRERTEPAATSLGDHPHP